MKSYGISDAHRESFLRRSLLVSSRFGESMFYHYWTSWYSKTQCNMPIMMEAKNFESREELQAKMAGALTNFENIEPAQIIIDMKTLARKIA